MASNAAASTTTGAPTGELLQLDPKALAAHPDNVRTDLGDLSDFVKTIPVVGILQPLTVARTEDGGYRILAGHRRCAAAVEAGLATVPCVERSDLGEGAEAVTAMIIENERRKDLMPAERARGYQQLAGFGLTPAAIAKRTATKRAVSTPRSSSLRRRSRSEWGSVTPTSASTIWRPSPSSRTTRTR